MDARENWLRTVEYRYPEWIPCTINLMPIAWQYHRGELEKLVLEHPRLLPGFEAGRIDYDKMPNGYREGQIMKDKWGCERLCLENGIAGLSVRFPLDDWSKLPTYQPPDPLSGTLDEITQGHYAYIHGRDEPMNWEEAEADCRARRERGELVFGDGEKLFDRMYMLRGFENLMMDIALEAPELDILIGMVRDYELKLIDKWLEIGVDVMRFHTDFATQTGLMISPASFRKYLVPLFTTLFQKCRDAGVHVVLSSDGVTLGVVDDLVACGVSVQDPQLRPNTAKGIGKHYKGKLCAAVDLDQQGFPFMTPAEIRDMVKEVVDEVALPEGGLMLTANIYDTITPLANIAALMESMEEFCFQKP